MSKIIFLLGWFCLNGECVNVNEQYQSVEDCKNQGMLLKSMLDEQNIRKYFLSCIDINSPTY